MSTAGHVMTENVSLDNQQFVDKLFIELQPPNQLIGTK